MTDRRIPLQMRHDLLRCPECGHEWTEGPHRCPECDPIGQRLERMRTGNETLGERIIGFGLSAAVIAATVAIAGAAGGVGVSVWGSL
ncbi:MAG: hypothetical protein ACQEUZ_06330 [Pseudomonadota bacterium]